MTEQLVFERVAPIVPVGDLEVALERYARLGFTAQGYKGPERYGFVDYGPVSMHLTETPGHDPKTAASAVYLYVADPDAVYSAWTAAEPGGHFHPPRDTPWGMREFSYVDPDGTLHRIGKIL